MSSTLHGKLGQILMPCFLVSVENPLHLPWRLLHTPDRARRRYIIYKAPNVTDKTTGLEYIYIDSKDQTKKTSTDHNKLINHPDGVLANTLKPILKPIPPTTTDFGFISYSDQPPAVNGVTPSVASTYGHSKGVVMIGKPTGVWLLHSTPRFPFKRDNNFWPPSGAAKAQTFICVTFKYEEFEKIGQHLKDIAAFPFDHHIPPGFHQELIDVKEKKKTPGQKIQDLTSAGGADFQSFAKKLYEYKGGKSRRRRTKTPPKPPRKPIPKAKPITKAKAKAPSPAKQAALKDPKRFDGDLYRAIAEKYDTDVRVQTWGCQAGRDGSYCVKNQRQVIKIESVKADLGKGDVRWKASNDHSKWCVGKDKHLICIADVNRALSQYQRPGGALCFRHQQASELFKGLITRTEPCLSLPGATLYKRGVDSDPDCDMDCEADNPYCDPEPMEVE
ncbi:deoxyribonuclease-2-alpha-like [Perca flavescens]|uniref:deoxyribonuclease-2-alpha-like n=1 Tax=Perca flavescens TaxID=8167 RepID=UPI00106E0E64|nr:deoxyribonuclease-2-alpha-like [Perca flavescens]